MTLLMFDSFFEPPFCAQVALSSAALLPYLARCQPDYGRMSNRELNRLAYRRFGPGYREECESRGNRRRALIDLLESRD